MKLENDKEDNELDNEEDELMNLVGKKDDEIHARKITKEKLKVTKVPKLVLGYQDDLKVYFRDQYKYLKFLGTGSFGFVVAGHQIDDSKQIYALKVSLI